MASDASGSDVHTIGTRVWVRDEVDSWKKGEVIKVDGGSLQVRVEGGATVTVKAEEAHIQNPDSRGGVEVRSMRACTSREACGEGMQNISE